MKSRVVEENWNADCDKAFAEIKRVLTTSPLLGFADFSRPFILETDASLQGLGAVLMQDQEMDDESLRMLVELFMDLSVMMPNTALPNWDF